ncbi:MAG TPA: Dabb family protein [Hyphomonadaceae bacterium]|nr:Dabb family protein [Hyphomonadaceae bacterium]HPI47054.1 Dabb family protein [Hyphomonadaceae bacterium]HPN07508.1 Dabb family protein [Hyphomonadaceae bacterium]
MIRHIVFFTLKDPSETPEIIDHLMRLGTIPGSTLFEVTQNRKADLFGNEIDVVVYAEFPGIDALHAYKKHPTYTDVTNIVRPRRELRFAADVEG